MSIRAGVIISVAFEQVNYAPHAKTSAQSNDKGLQNIDGFIEKIHKYISRNHRKGLLVMFHRHTKAGTICRPVSGGRFRLSSFFPYFFVIVRFVRQWPRKGQLRRIDTITPCIINLG